jgi:serine/threonine-protein kinase ATR
MRRRLKIGTNQQLGVMLNQISSVPPNASSASLLRPLAVEASWATSDWEQLRLHLNNNTVPHAGNFNVGVGSALLALHDKNLELFETMIDRLRQDAARKLSSTTTTSLQGCHDTLLKLHVLHEMELMSGVRDPGKFQRPSMLQNLDQRLQILGAFSSDKQYLLSLRRALLQLSRSEKFQFKNTDALLNRT